MTTAIALLPGFGSTFSSLAGFYAADATRWPSREVDLGLCWRGSGPSSYRAAFIEDSHELYLFEHLRSDGGGGMVFLHERRSARWGDPETFAGWQRECDPEGSLDWFLARANARAAR